MAEISSVVSDATEKVNELGKLGERIGAVVEENTASTEQMAAQAAQVTGAI